MSKVIYKYAIPYDNNESVLMPAGAKIINVGTQREQAFIWALVDPAALMTARKILVYATGQYLDETKMLQYLGTFRLDNGNFVYYVFEELR